MGKITGRLDFCVDRGALFIAMLCAALALLSACDSLDTGAGKLNAPRGTGIVGTDLRIEVSGGSIVICWKAEPGAEFYEISRAGSRLGEYQSLGTVTDAAFTDAAPNPVKYENYYRVRAKSGDQVLSEKLISFELMMFGPSMKFYDIKYDRMADIRNEVNAIHDNEMLGSVVDADGRRAEFSSKRYALYFKPGTYSGFDRLKIGFYTHAAGLGAVPAATKLAGSVETPPHLAENNATCTFWRSIENFEIDGGTFKWGVSQAAPARRMKVNVPATFDWDGGWASGGYTGDSYYGSSAGSYSQQQWYGRNSHFSEEFHGVNWNKVMQGSTGIVTADNWGTGGSSTKIDETPVIREKPFLYIDEGVYKVFVPALRRNASGVSWTDTDMGEGYSLDLEKDFYVARPGLSTADSINAALDQGKHVFFAPGRYELDSPLHIKKAGTVMLGTGFATLIPSAKNRYGALFIDDVDNVTVAGLMFDALYSSEYLLCAGEKGAGKNHSAAPVLLSDIFLRVGGYRQENVHANIAALINSSDVIGDHFWVWRADHGQGVGWNTNTSKNGLVVTGDRVTFYGLFVEHFHEYQCLWTGEDGRTYFYQSETPYDPVNQSAYKSHGGTVDGWASYKVANNVNRHFAVGLGLYAVFNRTGQDRNKSQSMFIDNAIEVPNKSGVTIKHACIVELSGNDTATVKTGIRSIVNGTGAGVGGRFGREAVVSYNNGIADTGSGNRAGAQPLDEIFSFPDKLLP